MELLFNVRIPEYSPLFATPNPTMLSFFTLWAKVKALAGEKLQAGPY
jgi:hypothetical protein